MDFVNRCTKLTTKKLTNVGVAEFAETQFIESNKLATKLMQLLQTNEKIPRDSA